MKQLSSETNHKVYGLAVKLSDSTCLGELEEVQRELSSVIVSVRLKQDEQVCDNDAKTEGL